MKMSDAVAIFNWMTRGKLSKGFLIGKGMPHTLETYYEGPSREQRAKIAKFLREIADGLMDTTQEE